jgi:hypothetical protein
MSTFRQTVLISWLEYSGISPKKGGDSSVTLKKVSNGAFFT